MWWGTKIKKVNFVVNGGAGQKKFMALKYAKRNDLYPRLFFFGIGEKAGARGWKCIYNVYGDTRLTSSDALVFGRIKDLWDQNS